MSKIKVEVKKSKRNRRMLFLNDIHVCWLDGKGVLLYEYWKHSRATVRYVKEFIRKYTPYNVNTRKDIEKLIYYNVFFEG